MRIPSGARAKILIEFVVGGIETLLGPLALGHVADDAEDLRAITVDVDDTRAALDGECRAVLASVRPLEANAFLADEAASRGVGGVRPPLLRDDQIADAELLEFVYLVPVEICRGGVRLGDAAV